MFCKVNDFFCLGIQQRQDLKLIDNGYQGDCPRGWFDIQNQGICNDYCRWVGDCGCRGECSSWSCALAGSSDQFTTIGQYNEEQTIKRQWDHCGNLMQIMFLDF